MEPNLWEVRPRLAHDGYTLTGPTLPHALWYRDEEHAREHARSRGADKLGRLVCYNLGGEVSHEETWTGRL